MSQFIKASLQYMHFIYQTPDFTITDAGDACLSQDCFDDPCGHVYCPICARKGQNFQLFTSECSLKHHNCRYKDRKHLTLTEFSLINRPSWLQVVWCKLFPFLTEYRKTKWQNCDSPITDPATPQCPDCSDKIDLVCSKDIKTQNYRVFRNICSLDTVNCENNNKGKYDIYENIFWFLQKMYLFWILQ